MFVSSALYTDAAKVTAALAFQAPETLNSAVNINDTMITFATAVPNEWQLGSTLVVDGQNQTLRETVMITGKPNAQTVTVSPFIHAHNAGAPVNNATLVQEYVAAASRWFDSVTYTPSGFAYETLTDKKTAYISNDGYIVIPLSKPIVDIADVTAITFQQNPLSPVDTLDIAKAWIEDSYFLKVVPAYYYYCKQGMATVTYKGGYNPIPDDITRSVTAMAARFYKERDSGYSDVIGSSEMGTFTYKRAMPADVKVIVERYRRWTE